MAVDQGFERQPTAYDLKRKKDEKLYNYVREGKIRMEDLNDDGLNALKGHLSHKLDPYKQKTDHEYRSRKAAPKNEAALSSRKLSDRNENSIPLSQRVPKGANSQFLKDHPKIATALNAWKSAVSPVEKVFTETTGGKAVNRASDIVGNILTSGASHSLKSTSDRQHRPISTGIEGLDTAADVIGTIGGYAGFGRGTVEGSGKGLQQLMQRLAPATPRLAQNAARAATEGGISSASIELADMGQDMNQRDETARERLANIALGTGVGGAIGAAAEPLAKLAGGELSKLFARLKKSPVTDTTKLKEAAELLRKKPSSEVPVKLPSAAEIPKPVERSLKDAVGIQTQQPYSVLRNIPLAKRSSEKTVPLKDLLPLVQKQEQRLNSSPVPIGELTDELRKKANPSIASSLGPIESLAKRLGKNAEPKPIGEENANSFRSKINRTPKQESGIMSLLKNSRTQFVDDLAPLERLEKAIKGNIGSAEESLYKQGRLYRGSPTKSHEIIRTELGPVMDNLGKKGYSPEDLGDYALAVHARDVNKMGIQSGFTNQEIDDVIRKFAPLEEERTGLIKASEKMLNELADNGVISNELVKILREKYPNYMPLSRAFDDEKVDFVGGLSQSLANVTSPLKRLKGSERDVIDPLESMVKNIFQANNASTRNKVAGQLSKLAELDTEGSFVRRLPDGEAVGRKNVVSVLENGQKVQYEVPQDAYKAMLNLDTESSNLLIKILQKPASALRAGATLTPEFSMRNWMRDVPTAFITSKSGFNPIVDFPIGLIHAIGKGRPIKLFGKQVTLNGKDLHAPGKLYHDFIMANGGYGNMISMDRNVHRDALEKVLKQPVSKQFVNIVNPKKWFEVLQKIADVSETATKLGEFRRAIKKGVSTEEAAYRARDVMDFARAGNSIREANKVVAFLNANIQGKSKLFRAFVEDPLGTSTKSLVALTLPTVGVFYAQRELANEEQKKIINDAPDWLKNSFWLVPVPMTNQVARIPKPFDLAPMFANLPERLLEEFANNNPQEWGEFAKDSLGSLTVPVMLTGLMPFIEGMANYSFFRQGPIIPQRESNLEFPDQYDINTSEVAKLLGKGVNSLTGGEGAFKNFASPRVIDNTIRGTLGGLGDYASSGIDGLLKTLRAVNQGPEKPEPSLSRLPVLKAFLVNDSSTGKAMDRLYKEKDRLTREKGSAVQNGIRFDNGSRLKMIDNATDQIAKINKRMRQIQDDPNMSSSTKRQLLEDLNEKRNAIASQSMLKLTENGSR